MKLIFEIIAQLFWTLRQSLGHIKAGNAKGALYWFYVRNVVSFFGNRAGHNSVSHLTDRLCLTGFQELPNLKNDTVLKLQEHFLSSQDNPQSNLEMYFENRRSAGIVRPDSVDISLNKNLMSAIINELGLLPKVTEFLGLEVDSIHINATIDSLIRLTVDRKIKNNYDDALEFHRDIDSLAFVKVFSYLVDVKKGCGEHELYPYSHKNLPWNLRLIKRFKQKKIEQIIPNLRLKSVEGKQGYSWIEDTTVLHRGTIPSIGDRLIITLCFNDSRSIKSYADNYYPLKNLNLFDK